MAQDSRENAQEVLLRRSLFFFIYVLDSFLNKSTEISLYFMCSVSVTTCGLAREALRLLRERKDGYDIVISDVNMPDMDGFKLLEHVGLELDLPVISEKKDLDFLE